MIHSTHKLLTLYASKRFDSEKVGLGSVKLAIRKSLIEAFSFLETRNALTDSLSHDEKTLQ